MSTNAMGRPTPRAFADQFVNAMATSDMAHIAASIHPSVRAYITNASGGSDEVTGREALLERLPDFASMADSFNARITQSHEVDDRTVLTMVEIRAQRLGRSLHNFAGILLRLSGDGRLIEYRMVEALPEESDRFWSATTGP